jgi:hypothetical protein
LQRMQGNQISQLQLYNDVIRKRRELLCLAQPLLDRVLTTLVAIMQKMHTGMYNMINDCYTQSYDDCRWTLKDKYRSKCSQSTSRLDRG